MGYLTKSKKTPRTLFIIEQAVGLLELVGIPVKDKSERSLEKMAMAFLAVAGVTENWGSACGISEKRFLKTREIIGFINSHFEEQISRGSYDDIRRKDLKPLILAELVIPSAENPDAATNDPTRGYALAPDFTELIRKFGTPEWELALANFLQNKTSLADQLARRRDMKKMPVLLPDGTEIWLSSGQHNVLQKQIIEHFLPLYGNGCQVLYIGDTSDKDLHIKHDILQQLNFFELSHDKLPDIIAYNAEKNWLYLIEAVHSSGPITEMRLLELKRLTELCKAEIIYVTAFLTKADFRKWADQIAWETEAWVAENPDHLIHFNGDKFLGPHVDHSSK